MQVDEEEVKEEVASEPAKRGRPAKKDAEE
jgi:hypothetical protein